MRIECFEPYDAVFFDLDGTLYDDQQYDRGAYALIAEHFPDESDLQTQLLELKRRRGRLDGNLFDDYCRERGLTGEAAVRMVQIYRDFVPQTLPMDSQMEKLLQLLESRKLFLVTNGRTVTQTKKIKALGLEKRFTRIYICDDRHWPFKPDPSVYLDAHKLFEFKHAAMVGDSLTIDGEFARNAGIDFFHHSVVA